MEPNASKDQFIQFCKNLSNGGKSSDEYKKLYGFLLKCFTEADENYDGRVNAREFDKMIEVTAAVPRKYGYAPTWTDMYTNEEGRRKGRAAMFSVMDSNNDGSISFDEFLDYCYNHITEKSKGLK